MINLARGNITSKLLALLSSAVLTLAAVIGYVLIGEEIVAGEKMVAEGHELIRQKLPDLVAGKAELASGKQALSAGKQEYEQAHNNKLLVLADTVMNSGKGFAEGREKIAAGEQKIAQGEDQIRAGEKQFAAGTMALRQGDEQLKFGRDARLACAVAAVLFGILSLVLGFLWRNLLAEFIRAKIYPRITAR